MNDNFNNQKQRAIEEMLKMQGESTHQQEPKSAPKPPPHNDLFGGLDIPFLNNIKTDSDLTLILGLLLLLLNEKADKRLLFALFYILL